MALEKDKIYKRSSNIVTRTIEDEIIFIPVKEDESDLEVVYNLNNEVSIKIWELIDGKKNLCDIKNNLMKEFEVKEEKLEKDLGNFIKELVKAGVIEVK